MKRIFLFMLTNILVMATITIVCQLLGIGKYTTPYGINYEHLALFCLVWGFGGAFISLAISRWMAKMSMGVQVIDPDRASGDERWLIDTVHRLAKDGGMTTMPEVGIYDSPEINAFATGPSKSRSLVAVSSGLLHRMDRAEVEGVLGHEIAHITNGDMVTMTLIQGVVNAFVMFFARIIAFAISQAMPRGENGEPHPMAGIVNFAAVFILEMVFSVLGMIVVSWFSRWREYHADQGGAALTGKGKMIAALEALQRAHGAPRDDAPAMASMKISGGGMMAMFSTHPPLEERIARLRGDR